MPKDRILFPSNFKYKHTLDPVEMTKRNLDDLGTVYSCRYNPVGDVYEIVVTQQRELPSEMLRLIRQRGFMTTGTKRFFYRKYSTIAANAIQASPIYDNLSKAPSPRTRAPDPYNPDEV